MNLVSNFEAMIYIIVVASLLATIIIMSILFAGAKKRTKSVLSSLRIRNAYNDNLKKWYEDLKKDYNELQKQYTEKIKELDQMSDQFEITKKFYEKISNKAEINFNKDQKILSLSGNLAQMQKRYNAEKEQKETFAFEVIRLSKELDKANDRLKASEQLINNLTSQNAGFLTMNFDPEVQKFEPNTEYAIGEKVNVDGVVCEVTESESGCENCHFLTKQYYVCSSNMCLRFFREDKKEIIYKPIN